MTDIKVESITPEMAKAILKDRNPRNRAVRRRVVKQYAADMKNGKWQITGDPIRFDREGNLIDGQHRLNAVIEADTAIQTVVIHNLERSTQDVIDTGAKRSAGNVLQMRGMVKNTNAVATVARVGISYERGHMKTTKTYLLETTHSEVLDWVEQNYTGLLETFNMSHKLSKYTRGSMGAIQYAFHHLYTINPKEAKKFLEDLVELRSGGKGDPRATLHRTLVTLGQTGHYKAKPAFTVYAIFKAWNAVRENKQILVIADNMTGIALPTPKP